jgi:hypothetical protein
MNCLSPLLPTWLLCLFFRGLTLTPAQLHRRMRFRMGSLVSVALEHGPRSALHLSLERASVIPRCDTSLGTLMMSFR